MYILDTSSLRGLSRTLLQGAKHLQLAISPLTFYELLCHLDEKCEGRETDEAYFAKQKGNLLKCRSTILLHDPFAGHAVTVGVQHLANPTRFNEPYLINQVLERLAEANTLMEFQNSEVLYPDLRPASCRDISRNAREVLKQEETRYIEDIKTLAVALIADLPECARQELSSAELGKLVLQDIRSTIESYRSEGIEDDHLPVKALTSDWIHQGYKYHRTAQYLRKASGDLNRIKIDGNDCEDCFIALHLQLFRADTLVTDDKGTLFAVRASIGAFRENFKELGIDLRCAIIDQNEFKSIASQTL